MSETKLDPLAPPTGMIWAEDADGPLRIYFKDGTDTTVASVTGGGMLVRGEGSLSPDAGYELHAESDDGEPLTFPQATIAAVVSATGAQVEFGNPFVATFAGHPRGMRGQGAVTQNG